MYVEVENIPTDVNEIIFRFSMVDQLVEGHQWLKNTLNYKPKSSWSVDPFGHGAAFPYILKSSGIDGNTRFQFIAKIWVKSNVSLKTYLFMVRRRVQQFMHFSVKTTFRKSITFL